MVFTPIKAVETLPGESPMVSNTQGVLLVKVILSVISPKEPKLSPKITDEVTEYSPLLLFDGEVELGAIVTVDLLLTDV